MVHSNSIEAPWHSKGSKPAQQSRRAEDLRPALAKVSGDEGELVVSTILKDILYIIPLIFGISPMIVS